jgi:hypothetical protein
LKIWQCAVKLDIPIKPYQVEPTSNKFFPYRKSTIPTVLSREETFARAPITAAQLSRTCHQIYDEVSGTHLFYHINEFEFDQDDNMLTYLVAITPVRASAISSLTYDWNWWPRSKPALIMLATCEGLRNLTIRVGQRYEGHAYFDRNKYIRPDGFECLKSLRGLETVKLDFPNLKVTYQSGKWSADDADSKEGLTALKQIRKEIGVIVTERQGSTVSLRQIRGAEEASRLNIYGAGRLGPDKKPGMVASRTRGQLEKEKSLNDLGVIPETIERPKFSEFGDLLWEVEKITVSRESNNNEGIQGVEVQVMWHNGTEASWEILERIINVKTVYPVVRYYVKHPDAYDIGTAARTITEFVEKGQDQQWALRCLSIMMKRDDSPQDGAAAKRLLRTWQFRCE